MTGRDPRRFGFQANLNNAAPHYSTRPNLLGLPPNERTIADHLRNAGYATALIGKWHLGTGEPFHPNVRGFDYFCGMLGGGHHYFPETIDHSIERNGEAVTQFSSEYLTDFFTDECIAFMQRQGSKQTKQPWFVLASYNAPHTPMHAKEADLARFAHIKDSKRRTYAAMMFALDRGIGRIRKHLESTGQWDSTLCVFFSDNGGPPDNRSWNGPLRGIKGCLREGGIRVPMIWSWPDKVPAGRTCSSVVSSLDLLPTFMAAAKSDLPSLEKPMSHQDAGNGRRMANLAGAYDGINLLPLLANPNQSIPRRLYWRLQGQSAILDGDDKLVRLTHRPAELFRPAVDPGESNELSAAESVRTDELLRLLGRWEFTLPTVPAWGSSPRWNGESAKGYDKFPVQPEPESNLSAIPSTK
jgi:arylsulfatase B